MATADEQIRVSRTVKRLLDHRRRDDESYNDALKRILGEDGERDLLAGFDRWSDDHADRVREIHEKQRNQSLERMNQLAETE